MSTNIIIEQMLWGLVVLWFILSSVGYYYSSTRILFVSSVLLIIFSIVTIFSIGFYTLIIAILQLAVTSVMYRAWRRKS